VTATFCTLLGIGAGAPLCFPSSRGACRACGSKDAARAPPEMEFFDFGIFERSNRLWRA
jgi:hypothetical protein